MGGINKFKKILIILLVISLISSGFFTLKSSQQESKLKECIDNIFISAEKEFRFFSEMGNDMSKSLKQDTRAIKKLLLCQIENEHESVCKAKIQMNEVSAEDFENSSYEEQSKAWKEFWTMESMKKHCSKNLINWNLFIFISIIILATCSGLLQIKD